MNVIALIYIHFQRFTTQSIVAFLNFQSSSVAVKLAASFCSSQPFTSMCQNVNKEILFNHSTSFNAQVHLIRKSQIRFSIFPVRSLLSQTCHPLGSTK